MCHKYQYISFSEDISISSHCCMRYVLYVVAYIVKIVSLKILNLDKKSCESQG